MALVFPFPIGGSVEHDADQVYAWLDDMFSEGVRAFGDLLVVQRTVPNVSVRVRPGDGYVDFTASSDGGTRRIRLTSESASGTPGSPGADWIRTFETPSATLPRVDRVVATVQDEDLDSSGESRWKFDVVPGTPTSGATLANLNGVAAVPDNSLLLANVLVRAAATTILSADIDPTVAPVAALGAGNALSSLAPAGLVLVADRELEADGVVDFAGISQAHGGLFVVGQVRAASVATESTAVLRFNGDDGNNYDYQRLVGVGGGTAASLSPPNQVANLTATVTTATSSIALGVVPASSAPAGLYAALTLWIPGYADSKNKAVIGRMSSKSGQADASFDMTFLNGHWRSNAGISSIRLAETGGGLLDAGSRVSLYAMAVS